MEGTMFVSNGKDVPSTSLFELAAGTDEMGKGAAAN